MRNNFKNFFKPLWQGILLATLLLSIAAVTIQPQLFQRDIKISNTTDSVGLTIQKGGSQSSNAIAIYRGSTLEFAVPGSNVASGLKFNLGIQSGSVVTTTDGTVTNTFSNNFSSVPIVTVTPFSLATIIVTNQVKAVTTSNFVYKGQATGLTNHWMAIGPP